ncbi:RM53 protein, partial [Rhodinocichla rosea]|nr:RM53 protein [Rhodinocichla rosea]
EKMASKVSLVLRPVKSIVVRFCPFEPNVESTSWIYMYKTTAHQRSCHFVTSQGFSSFLADGDRLIMKGAHLTTGEMLAALASRCNAKDLKEEQKSKKKNP